MSTRNQIDSPLSGNTGTGNFVGANTPTLITPAIGAATGTSLNLGSSTTMTGMIDDDTMATASASTAASSESIKAYVDSTAAAGGKIVQYVISTSSTEDTTTSATLANTSLTASITPTNASNIILIQAYYSVRTLTTAVINNAISKTAIYRSTGTPGLLVASTNGGVLFATAGNGNGAYNPMTMMVQEVAGDTNVHTYYVRFAINETNSTCAFNQSSPATMILYELVV